MKADFWTSYRACVVHQHAIQPQGDFAIVDWPAPHHPHPPVAEVDDMAPNLLIWTGQRHDYVLKLKNDLAETPNLLWP
jgi:hypothetical protein